MLTHCRLEESSPCRVMCRLVNEAARKDENGLVGSATGLFCNDDSDNDKAFGSVVTLCIP